MYDLPIENGQVLLPASGITALIRDMFCAAGGRIEEAEVISQHLVEATASGHDSHGIIRVPRYLEALDNGFVSFNKTPRTIVDSESLALFDGEHGFGQWIARQTTATGITKAKTSGIAIVGLRNAGHIGRIGAWAEQACAAGIASIHFVNVVGAVLVAPFGGAGRRMSTNPVSIGIPNPEGDDFLLDFATSRVAEGKVLVAQKAGKEVDADSLVDETGQRTGDPSALYGEVAPGDVPNPRLGTGALTPMGEHKGSGLSIACELLAGALTGSGTSGVEGQVHNGMLSIFINPAVMDDGHSWSRTVGDYLDFVRSCPSATLDGSVLIPGDPERRARAERFASGIPLDQQSFNDMMAAGERYGLSQQDAIKTLHS